MLIDGRSLYSTLHSGVFWDLRQPLLEDIEQIEVISGPGGTLYGPNAVNGVINITTRDSRETIGGLIRAHLRHPLADRGRALRLRARRRRGAAHLRQCLRPRRPARRARAGRRRFRSRATGSASGPTSGSGGSTLTLQGDYFEDENDQRPGDGDRGGNLTLRWRGDLDEQSSLQVQAYYDHFRRRFLLARDALETFDLEAQYNRSAGAHDIVAGFGVRTTRDEFINTANIFGLDPAEPPAVDLQRLRPGPVRAVAPSCR